MYCLAVTKNQKYLVTSYRNIVRKKEGLFVKSKGYEYQLSVVVRYGIKKDLSNLARNLSENIPQVLVERNKLRRHVSCLTSKNTNDQSKVIETSPITHKDKSQTTQSLCSNIETAHYTTSQINENNPNSHSIDIEVDSSLLNLHKDICNKYNEKTVNKKNNWPMMSHVLVDHSYCFVRKDDINEITKTNEIITEAPTNQVDDLNYDFCKEINNRKEEDRYLDTNNNQACKASKAVVNDDKNLVPINMVSVEGLSTNKDDSKPFIRSVIAGNFVQFNDGFTKTVIPQMDFKSLDEIPIIFITAPENNSFDEGMTFNPIIDQIPQSIVSGEFRNSTIYDINGTETGLNDDKLNETTIFQIQGNLETQLSVDSEDGSSINNEKDFVAEDREDSTYEPSENQDSDSNSESSDSHISELEELDDFGEVDSEKDELLRDSLDTSGNFQFNISQIQLPDNNSFKPDASFNSEQQNVLDDTPVSIPTSVENSRLSTSTLNQSKNDSTYVPEMNSSIGESIDVNSIDQGSKDHRLNIDKLMSRAVAPVLEELEVAVAGTETKKTFCCFCFELKAVPSRHYRDVHGEEKEVKAFLAMKKNSSQRKAAIEELRLRGINMYNLNKDFNQGNIIVTRQPRKTSIANATDYKPCPECGKWLLNIKRHKCLKEKDHYEDRSHLVRSKIIMGQIHENANELTRKILAINNDDEISQIVRYDPLLIIFINDLSERYSNQHQHKMIRSRMRMLGSILLKIKEYNQSVFKPARINQKPNAVDVNEFADILDPRIYDNLIVAIQSIVGVNTEKSECRAPSTATTAGTWITKVAKIYEKELIKNLAYEEAKNVEYFLKVHEVEFPTRINTLARNVLTQQKRHKQEFLPVMDDINSFRDYVESNLVQAIEALTEGFTYYAWKKLSQCTLIFILLFNRKRPGELERIRIDDFKKAKSFEGTNKDEYHRLSENDKELVDEYLRIEFSGKKGREVPLLLSTGMRSFINTILLHRPAAGVHTDNPFIFGLPGFDGTRYKHLEACVLMRNFSKRCNAKFPDRLRAAGLRKHFATTVASLKIDECQIYDVSNFMGHAEKIHRDYYRQTVVTRDVCGVSKILEVASGVKRVEPTNQSSFTTSSQEQPREFNRDILESSVSSEVQLPNNSGNSDLELEKSFSNTRKRQFGIRSRSKSVRPAPSEDESDDSVSKSYEIPNKKLRQSDDKIIVDA
ncbi:uncharacterized protein LOC141526516 isoform X2 [Cotesia typhae]|uniref:uncharacterized protein LOC141526516 isoform X2 n=1 Tax=Cotesia typhae TaxID=2053667 RepID=UPI003D680449